MSNALPLLLAAAQATTQPKAEGIGDLSVFMTTLCGVGICVLAVWLGHGGIKPSKFGLSGTPGRANTLTPWHILGMLIGSLLASSMLTATVIVLTEGDKISMTIMAGLTFPLFLSCSLIVASFCFSGGAIRGMGFTARRWINDSIRSVVALMAVLPVCVGLLLLTKWALLQCCPDLIRPHEFLKILTDSSTTPMARTLIIFAAVVMAPIGEEIFFRGMMQSMLRRYLRRPWLAIVIASVMFASVHFPVPESLPALFALAIALGYSYERTGRLYAPIMIHALFNTVMIIDAVTNPL